jgi:hypothetical protein
MMVKNGENMKEKSDENKEIIMNLNGQIEKLVDNDENNEDMKEKLNYFELNVENEGQTKVFGSYGNNYVNNGLSMKRESLIGKQRIGVNINPMLMNTYVPKEYPFAKPQNMNFMNNYQFNMAPNMNTTQNNNLLPNYTINQNSEPELDNLVGENNLNVESNENELNTKKRKSMTFSKLDFEDDYKLPPSKTPIIDAIIYCAIKGEGITIESRDQSKILFKVTDYESFYEKQKQVCSKQNPTDDESSRIKTIQRWFKNFPTKKERSKTNQNIFYFSVEKSVSEDKFRKIGKIMERLEASINVNKRRRTK